jgi:hypothetical protein
LGLSISILLAGISGTASASIKYSESREKWVSLRKPRNKAGVAMDGKTVECISVNHLHSGFAAVGKKVDLADEASRTATSATYLVLIVRRNRLNRNDL